MSIEKDGSSTENFWRRLSLDLEIISFTYSRYDLHLPGIPSNNVVASEKECIQLNESLLHAGWPTEGDQLFGMGSLVYTARDELALSTISHLKKHGAIIKFRDLELLGAKPMSLVMLDCDCPNTMQNLTRIKNILEKNELVNWSIYDSGNSFIIIFHKLIKPTELPKAYGELIKMFAATEPVGKQVYFTQIANNLIDSSNFREDIKSTCNKILKEVSHQNDHKADAKEFIIDLRWMAHSLLELLDYLNGKTNSFAYIRTNSSKLKKPMQLLSISRVHKTLDGKIYSTSLDD